MEKALVALLQDTAENCESVCELLSADLSRSGYREWAKETMAINIRLSALVLDIARLHESIR